MSEHGALSRRGFLSGVAATGVSLTQLPAVVGASAPPARESESELKSLPRAPAPDDEPAWEKVAQQFLLRPGLIYLNTGTRGPSPRYVHERQVNALADINADYFGYVEDVYTVDFRSKLRAGIASFVGAGATEIALTNNTTDGMIIGTWGPPLAQGDQIVYTNHDHTSGAHPVLERAKRQGLQVGVVDLSDQRFHPVASPHAYLKAFEQAITPKTKLLSFCHINYSDGAVMPVKAICAMARAKGVTTLVDGAQGPGMLELDLHDLGCDMYAAPFHKWMLSSMLTGFFYVRADLQERVKPVLTAMPPNGIGMYGVPVTKPYWDEYKTGAAQYEPRGSHNIPARMAMAAALQFHSHLTARAVEARDRYLATRLRDGLHGMKGVKVYTSEDPRLNSALVPFTVDGIATEQLNKLLWQRNIYIRNVTHEEVGWDVNRASAHIMVTSSQIDTLLNALQDIAA